MSGGAIYASKDVIFVFNGTNSFIDNTAKEHGGAICAQDLAFDASTQCTVQYLLIMEPTTLLETQHIQMVV